MDVRNKYAGIMSGRLFSGVTDIPVLKTIKECDAALAQDSVLLFKHSPSCSVSTFAKTEVALYINARPETPVFMVIVQRREVASYLAAATGVPHASPQVIALRAGKLVGTRSHYGITCRSLSELMEN